MQEVAREFLKEKIIDKPIYKSAQEIFDYLYHSMRDLKKEVFKVIYLNSQNRLLKLPTSLSVLFLLAIMESTIKHNATCLIFAHNHPSGDPEPSGYDKLAGEGLNTNWIS